MKKFYLLKNPEVFQGEKNLKLNKNYFEGWYFKNINDEGKGISFIPGINIEGSNKKAFIQIITDNSSYFINYDIKDFKFNFNPFYIQIKNNVFSREGMDIDILDKSKDLKIKGKVQFSDIKEIRKNFLNPNIMGPFSYIPFMECNHAILSMKNNVQGNIYINNEELKFQNGIGYVEKDWGCSFPKSYIWCQGNNFENSNASFMISVANIPFEIFKFTGFICDFILNDQEYKFTTYNNAKIIKYSIDNNVLNITLKRGKYCLNVKSGYDEGLKLSAPVKGKMQKDILESICSTIFVTLKKGRKKIFEGRSENCGLEIVK